MSEPLKLGKIITTEQHRDAIHIAIAPASSEQALYPGQHVSLVAGSVDKVELTTSAAASPAVGIVDPYLRGIITPGQKFWLCLYPQTVTSLRHEWTHPAFAAATPALSEVEKSKAYSEMWLRDYARTHFDYTPEPERYETLLSQLRSGEIIYQGQDMHSRGDLDDEQELKRHAEIVLGITINFDDPGFVFSCTC